MSKSQAVVLVLFAAGVFYTAAQECPPGQTLVNCVTDPCTYTDCAPGYRCESNYCGGCNAECVSDCPADKPTAVCKVHPCATMLCAEGYTCQANYCGGCNGECVPHCSGIQCRMYCRHGFKKDARGCEICECNDPCETVKCSSGYVCKDGNCVEGCVYDGNSHALDERFPATDGCNTCFCQAGGEVGCTELYCPQCHYNGQSYKPGDKFKSDDGCNDCHCDDNGNVGCTKRACACTAEKPYTECPYNPCIAALCVQGTECVADQCGGCFANCKASSPTQCHADGKVYEIGESMPSSDSCNTCSCSQSGFPICTLRACTQCPLYKCKACNTGHVIDENGCQTCQCQDPACETVKCSSGHVCKEGECDCGDVMCSLYCDHGFKKDARGCDICTCHNPCETVKCSSGYVCKGGDCVEGCVYDGNTHAVDERFPATDGCNTCLCEAGGGVGCTEMYCPQCQYGGQSYKSGDKFKSADGCNDCHCDDNGNVACTERACACTADKPYTECPYNPCIAALCVQGTECVADQCGGCFANCKASSPTQCHADGRVYEIGESMPSSDGCNTCSCSQSGFPICTLRACTQCPLYKCKPCTTGHVIDENGCQTCQCQDPACELSRCRKGFYCSGGHCCPEFLKSVRCQDPCATKSCGFFRFCKRFCGCYASCEWWFLSPYWK